jgi:hypothetical protein
MRKATGLLFAMSLLVPVGVVAAGAPSGAAAAKGPTCKTFTASISVSPALPKLSSTAIVTATVKTTGKIGGCTGGPVAGVTGANVSTSYKYKGNCTTLLSGKGGVTTLGASSLTWSNGKTSTIATTTTTTSKAGATPITLQLVTKVTKGQYVGTTAISTVKETAPPGTCTTTGASKATLTGYGPPSTFK